MASSENAKNLKKTLMDTPEEEFEPFTFGELKEGQKFITFPSPGDNHGHGGFRNAHYLFQKTKDKVAEMLPGRPYSEDNPHGIAINTKNGTESHFSFSSLVTLVE